VSSDSSSAEPAGIDEASFAHIVRLARGLARPRSYACSVERALDVRTAEAIAVRYELAGIGSRFLALTLDFVIQAVVALAVIVALASISAPFAAVLTAARLGKPVEIVLLSLLSIGSFVLFFGYFIIFELVWNGQTPGKRVLGIRVVRDAGFPVDAGAAVVRNVVRIVETALGFYVISAVVMLVSNENKRPGDFAAGTIVVRDSAAVPLLDTLVRDDIDVGDGLEPADRALIDAFLARRPTLEHAAANEIAARIAGRVRPKLRASFHYLDDAALLEHLARSRV
jgi:uncharacterized RDD family membrane protein YckC